MFTSGYVYMNGETDKSSAGTMYASSPDQSITTPNDQQSTSVTANASILTQSTYVSRSNVGTGLQDTEFANMNGAMSGSSSDGAEMYPESGGTAGNGDGTTFTTPEGNSMPMDQLKQMLTAQLEYYFSRYVSVDQVQMLFNRIQFQFALQRKFSQ